MGCRDGFTSQNIPLTKSRPRPSHKTRKYKMQSSTSVNLVTTASFIPLAINTMFNPERFTAILTFFTQIE